VSADLDAIAHHPLVAVCAGAKAFLDLPRTLEHLETAGVPVLGWRHDWFPAFYPVLRPARAHRRLGRGRGRGAGQPGRPDTGVLLAVPIPVEDALDAAALDTSWSPPWPTPRPAASAARQ
jgi:pseudouridine-5'-phosphate glycosidase